MQRAEAGKADSVLRPAAPRPSTSCGWKQPRCRANPPPTPGAGPDHLPQLFLSLRFLAMVTPPGGYLLPLGGARSAGVEEEEEAAVAAAVAKMKKESAAAAAAWPRKASLSSASPLREVQGVPETGPAQTRIRRERSPTTACRSLLPHAHVSGRGLETPHSLLPAQRPPSARPDRAAEHLRTGTRASRGAAPVCACPPVRRSSGTP